MKENQQSRRMFVREIGGMTLACATGIAMLESCSPTQYIKITPQDDKLSVMKDIFQNDTFVVLKTPDLKAPIYLKKESEEEYRAVYMLCTHKGCRLKPAGENLYCPCHGSEFSDTGKVLASPAQRDLDIFRTTVETDRIIVHLS